MNRFSLFLATAFLAGCAASPATNQLVNEYERTVPICREGPDCERQWAAARRWVLDNARMKIQHYSPDYIETFNAPPNSPNLAVRVVKEPLNHGRHQIVIEGFCSNIFGCVPAVLPSKVDFNKAVNAAAVSTEALKTSQAVPKTEPTPTAPLTKSQWQQEQLRILQQSGVSYEEYQRRYQEIMAE